MVRKTRRDIERYTGSVIQLGLGTAITASMPGGSRMTPAFGATARMMPLVGTTMMGGNVLRMTKKLYKRKRKKRR